MSSTIIAAIRQGLVQNTAVTTLVPESRITSAYRQDIGTLPAIVLTVQSDEAVSPSFPRTDCLRRMQMNIECVAASLKLARELGETVRRAMHGAAGTASSTTALPTETRIPAPARRVTRLSDFAWLGCRRLHLAPP